MSDIREVIFADIIDKRFSAEVRVERDGVLSGVNAARKCAEELGLDLVLHKEEGQAVSKGETIANIAATPMAMAMAEEMLIGTLAKASGIATAAHQAVQLIDGKAKVVAGAWKKMPQEMKFMVRQAVVSGGAVFRMTDIPMIYLDKNFITMLGSIPNALAAVSHLSGYDKVVQIRGKLPVETETLEALAGGCTIFMVDTGQLSDLDVCLETLYQSGRRAEVKVAFASEIKLAQIPMLAEKDIDLLCIGKEIVDAPLLDMRLDVMEGV